MVLCCVTNHPNAQWLKTTILIVHNYVNLSGFHGNILSLLHLALTGMAQMELEDPLPKWVHWYTWQGGSGWWVRPHSGQSGLQFFCIRPISVCKWAFHSIVFLWWLYSLHVVWFPTASKSRSCQTFFLKT